ncbi:MAG: 50S ribosomal protein L28 [Candidatus Krumholzibacteria bacterium]|nr:50S ribosomal protein L28 [Candidatus Krumholzibacteria bacterium]MDP6668985.1 50S ribosomal protein L28 [Candidatus Krumholzibacteria bacterium]MDP6797522.1 50S ribosomal protein L28 [Candidatus Krumholzibacteria bacterium]MDP7021369.1 50S ribosomal protein L28 [Candidatus Krumholzibacteria bacterium]
MSKRCAVTGKGPRSGNNVSHAKNRSKRWFKPNLQKKRVMIDGKMQKVWVSASGLRELDRKDEA